VCKLLKPGGRIALFEFTEPDAMKTDFAFGLLPGWWRSADEYRDLSAGVSEDRLAQNPCQGGILRHRP
jgi:hypothetical protein